MPYYEQDEELIKKFLSGKSQTEIAKDMGVTRELVRQRLKRNGFSGRNYRWIPEREKLISILERSTSALDAAKSLGLTDVQLYTAIKHHAVIEAFENAKGRWKAHRREEYYLARQQPFISQVRELALKIGHTPRQEDLQAAGISHMTLIRTFGSLPKAMLASGLIPNVHYHRSSPLPTGFSEVNEPTANIVDADERANLLRSIYVNVPEPAGTNHPKHVEVVTTAYYRDPKVIAWVRQFADGICELCGEQGYETDRMQSYLEVHHVIPLSDNGPDTIWNAVAICETCHGKLHRAKNRDELKEKLYGTVTRLRPVDNN